MSRIGLLPAAGLATRMGGLPKFLLPLSSTEDTLLNRHIESMRKVVDRVVITTRPENGPLLGPYLASDVVVVIADTSTMSETVVSTASWFPSEAYVLGMPDTYIDDTDPYTQLVQELDADTPMAIGVWSIREEQRGHLGQVLLDEHNHVIDSVDKEPGCQYPDFWGIMSFSKSALSLIDPSTPHVGYSIIEVIRDGNTVAAVRQRGEYVDCGTPSEFHRVLARLAIKEPR